ncbi:hypothetical protein [Bacillus toyonensis]
MKFQVFIAGLSIVVTALICFSMLTNPQQNTSSKILLGIGIFTLGMVSYGVGYLFYQYLL